MSTHANEPGAQLPPTLTAEDAFLQGFGIGLKIRHNDNPAYDDWDMDAWAMLTVRVSLLFRLRPGIQSSFAV